MVTLYHALYISHTYMYIYTHTIYVLEVCILRLALAQVGPDVEVLVSIELRAGNVINSDQLSFGLVNLQTSEPSV